MAIIRYFGVYRGTLTVWKLSSEFLKSQVLKVWRLLYSPSNGVFQFFGYTFRDPNNEDSCMCGLYWVSLVGETTR